MTLRFFLGGYDLEMREIAALVRAECGAAALCDKGLAWGARLSDCADEIAAAHAAGLTPVAVELADDMPAEWAPRARLLLVDHHGARAGDPASIRQVFDLLGLPAARWSRHLMLVAANDSGHVEGMRAAGADAAEMRAIRAADRAAQGILPAEEAAGLAALRTGQTVLGGAALLVRLPHNRGATVTDPHALEPEFAALPRALVVEGPGSTHVFGPRSWIETLAAAHPSGWSGGGGPHGFFGLAGAPPVALAAIAATLSGVLALSFFQEPRIFDQP